MQSSEFMEQRHGRTTKELVAFLVSNACNIMKSIHRTYTSFITIHSKTFNRLIICMHLLFKLFFGKVPNAN